MNCIAAGILQTAKIALTDGIVVAPGCPIRQITAIPATTVMAVQRKRTGNHAQRDTSALVVTNLNHVLLAFTKTKLLNLIANPVSLDISARTHLLPTIQVTNALLATIVLGKRSPIHNSHVLLVHSII